MTWYDITYTIIYYNMINSRSACLMPHVTTLHATCHMLCATAAHIMRTCAHTHTRICVHIRVNICMYLHLHPHRHLHLHLHLHTHTHKCDILWICIYIYIYIYTHMHVCVCMYMCVYIYIYIYTYRHIIYTHISIYKLSLIMRRILLLTPSSTAAPANGTYDDIDTIYYSNSTY